MCNFHAHSLNLAGKATGRPRRLRTLATSPATAILATARSGRISIGSEAIPKVVGPATDSLEATFSVVKAASELLFEPAFLASLLAAARRFAAAASLRIWARSARSAVATAFLAATSSLLVSAAFFFAAISSALISLARSRCVAFC